MHACRPVDLFVTYDGKRAADIPPPRYAVRHLVAAEVRSRWHPAGKSAVVLSHLLLDTLDRCSARRPSNGVNRANEGAQNYRLRRPKGR